VLWIWCSDPAHFIYFVFREVLPEAVEDCIEAAGLLHDPGNTNNWLAWSNKILFIYVFIHSRPEYWATK
jgi:hypothetical protein